MATPLRLPDAQARLLALVKPLPVERVDVPSALGRYLAEPLVAQRTQPAARVSAMDGYAVRADDLAGPWRVVGESAAGHPYTGTVAPREAVRISTGALLPAATDAVIVQEDTAREDGTITLTGSGPEPAGRHIRREGTDFNCHDALLPAGTRLGPAQLALAIAGGHRHIPVRRMPRLAVIECGDELAADPESCPAHQIPASNGVMIAALAAGLPVETRRIGPVADSVPALIAALGTAGDADVIVTTAGASVGDHDLVRPALEQWGATLDFWRVAIKPGKPLLIATRGSQLVVGLPGNPVSAFVTAHLFLLPLLRALLGAAQPLPRAVALKLGAALPATGDRQEFVRGHLAPEGVLPVSSQDSGALCALAATDLLIDRPAGSPALPARSEVPAYLLQNGGPA